MVACGGGADPGVVQGELLGHVDGEPLYAEAVANIQARDGIDAEAATQRAIETLQLVAMRRANQEPGLSPEREEQLRRAALARTYLRVVFEQEHRAEDIPLEYIDAKIDRGDELVRYLRPELHVVCNVIILPPDPPQDPDPKAPPKPAQVPDPKDDPTWKAEAQTFAAPLIEAMREREAELVKDDGCELVAKLVALSEQKSEDGRFRVRFENSVMEVDRKDLWSEAFVEALSEVHEPALVEPFFSEFGLHLVVVPRILEANFEDIDDPQARRAAQRERIREAVHERWLAEQEFPREIKRLADKHTVRLASSLGGSAP